MAPVRRRCLEPLYHTTLAAFVLVLVLEYPVRAQAPDSISFQGFLTDPGGTPLNTTASITFKLYKDGTAVWTETQPAVTVTNGLLNVLLGGVSPLDTVGFNRPMELGIKVGADPEIVPRTPLGAAPFALGIRGLSAVWADDSDRQAYNIIGGALNGVAGGVVGATISGGGGTSFDVQGSNVVTDDFGTISGGSGNATNGLFATIGGGLGNTANNLFGTIGGGGGNEGNGDASTIAGGSFNTAGSYAAVGGGFGNSAGASYATIAGGQQNQATGLHSVVAGGNQNVAGGPSAAVVGGTSNRATGSHAFVGGGLSNRAIGTSSTVPGGYENRAVGQVSFAAGHRSRANHDGVFIWNDRSATTLNDSLVSTAPNQFLIRAAGGVGIGRNDPAHPLHMASGAHVTAGGVWTNASSREWKEGFESVESRDILNRVASLPITRWRYTNEPGSVHMGPVAEDFHAAFGLGADDKHIAALDGSGVALAAIQGLLERLVALEVEVSTLRKELAAK